MHFVPVKEKVKYNLHTGAARDEKCIQIWAVEKSDGSYLDKPVLSGRWQPFKCHKAELYLYNSEVCGLYWVKSVDNISILQCEVNQRDLVTGGTGTGGGE